MTKEQFLKLNNEIGQLPPDLTIRKEYMEKRFKELGLSINTGYKTVQYYYSQLFKAKSGLKTIFQGKVIISDDHFGIVDNLSCYFKMTYENFDKRNELFFPTVPLEQPTLFNIKEIDFSQTTPEYFLNKIPELEAAYRIRFIITHKYIEQNPRIKGKVNIGDIDTKYPDWPKEPKLAFELFKNFYAYKFFLLTIHNFLKAVGSWNQRAIEDELNKYNLFIDEAKKINFREAAEQKKHLRNQYQNYILLANDYYLTHSIEKDWSYQLDLIYSHYFLFKDLLEKKSNKISNNEVTFSDFFDSDKISFEKIGQIQTYFSSYEGKSIAALIHLLKKYDLINIIRSNKEKGLAKFHSLLTNKPQKYEAVRKCFDEKDKWKYSLTDGTLLLIEKELKKIIEN